MLLDLLPLNNYACSTLSIDENQASEQRPDLTRLDFLGQIRKATVKFLGKSIEVVRLKTSNDSGICLIRNLGSTTGY